PRLLCDVARRFRAQTLLLASPRVENPMDFEPDFHGGHWVAGRPRSDPRAGAHDLDWNAARVHYRLRGRDDLAQNPPRTGARLPRAFGAVRAHRRYPRLPCDDAIARHR